MNFRFQLLVTWSSLHGCGVSSHIIWCKISISSPMLLTFYRNSRWRRPPSWITVKCEFGHSGVLVVWCLCSVPNLVQIFVIVTEIDAHKKLCLKPLVHDVTRINFRFWLLVTWSSPHGRDASSHIIWCKISLSISKVIDIFAKFKMAAVGESHGTTHEASFVARTSCKNFVMIG